MPHPTIRLAEGPLWFAGLLLALLLLALLLPEPARAQITTGLTPPARPPAPAVVARAESTVVAARDSAAREERLDLKAWVDSAARSIESGADPFNPGIPGDSLVPGPGRLPPTTGGRTPTTRYRPGAPAPDTATPLPLLLALGGVMTGAGVWLRRRR